MREQKLMQNNQELESELAFMEAMRRYRQAKESGSAEDIQKAEDAWREQVRSELAGRSRETD